MRILTVTVVGTMALSGLAGGLGSGQEGAQKPPAAPTDKAAFF